MKHLLTTTLIVCITFFNFLNQNKLFAQQCPSVSCYNQGFNTNAFFGQDAGLNQTGGFSNSFYGNRAGENNSFGNSNSFFGSLAGIDNTSGEENCFFGVQSGGSNITGENNSFIGRGAGFNITAGSNNIVIGRAAGPTTGNSAISNRLYIDVLIDNNFNGNDDPLIYGEFDNDFVRINGTFEVTAGLSNPSDVNLKANFKKIDQTEILKKLSQINIQKWTYKDRTNELHIGATAQDFYQAFGLGAGDKHISTIDADGVALAAIQALKVKNDKLQNEVDELKKIVSSLVKKLEE